VTVAIGLALAGVAVVVVLNMVARRTGLPAAVLLVVVGLVYSELPGPDLKLQPSFVLHLIIPPLLYGAAINSSALALRRNARTVASLSAGLVLATAMTVGAAVYAAIPYLPLAAAVALGAAVAPPDPVAALAIGRRAGLPPRLVSIIEGEGLLNDAIALTLFEVAARAASGDHPSLLVDFGQFGLEVVGGVVVGRVVGGVLGRVRRWLDEPLSENLLSLATPFAAYVTADSFGGSGVLAVVVAGLYVAHHSPSMQSGQSRLQVKAVWSLVEYALEGFVFLLIGEQLPGVITGLDQYPSPTIAAASIATVGAVLVTRPLWLSVSERLPARWHTRLGEDPGERSRHLDGREITALSWSGTRGVITLAAAFSIPLTTDAGHPFPGRDLLLFCAYLVVLVTLIGQGLTFSPLLHRLGFVDPRGAAALLRNQARDAAVRAALNRLDELVAAEEVGSEIAAPLQRAARARLDRYQQRIERLSSTDEAPWPADDPYFAAARARRSMIDAERDELVQWRDSGRLPDAELRALLRELDHEEGLLPPA